MYGNIKIAWVERLEEQAEVCSEASFLTYHNNQLEPGNKEWHQGHSKYNNQDKDTEHMKNFTQTIGYVKYYIHS